MESEEAEEEYYVEEEDFLEYEDEADDDPLPPPPDDDKELLFLIEFLVNTMTLFPENLDVSNLDPCALVGPTSIALSFLHFPPMTMGETDMDPERITGENVIPFNCGKSLMFALTEAQFENPPPVFLSISAKKDMPHAFRFPFLDIGTVKVDLSGLFKLVFDKYDEHPNRTVSKSIQDTYKLMNPNGKAGAEVKVYVRLTCMGQNIVTEFKRGCDFSDPMLFKNPESLKTYECKETEPFQPVDDPGKLLPGWAGKGRSCGDEEEDGDEPDEDCEEIFVDINGSAVRIKLEKYPKPDPPKPYHISEFCDCNIPLPPDLVEGMSDLSLSLANKGVNLIEQDREKIKKVGLDSANQLVFNVPPVGALVGPGKKTLVYNVNTCSEGKLHGHDSQTFRVTTGKNPSEPAMKLPNDPEKDVFILRVYKRGKRGNSKGAVEMEFRTPKDKIVPPIKPPYMVERSVGPDKSRDSSKKKK